MLKTELSIETQIHERTVGERDESEQEKKPTWSFRLHRGKWEEKKVQNLDSCRSHSCFEFSVKIPFYINQTKQSTVSPEKTLQNTKLSDNWWNKIHKIIQMVTHLLLNSQNSLLFSVQSRPRFFPLQEEEDSERKFRRKCKDQRKRRTQSSCPLHDTFFLSFSIPYLPFTKKTLMFKTLPNFISLSCLKVYKKKTPLSLSLSDCKTL